ncbi:hypothetical protein EON80_14690 [bacterium]|nr:MAG: hypothetical protein EON80_14690 [bacterium]
MLPLCLLLMGGNAHADSLVLSVPYYDLAPPGDPKAQLIDGQMLKRGLLDCSVERQGDEVQIRLIDFGWEGIVWWQFPVNAFSAAVKEFPKADKIRLFWSEFRSMGGHWTDRRHTVLFSKSSGKLRFYMGEESFYLDQVHFCKEYSEMEGVAPPMFQHITDGFTPKRVDSFTALLQQGARLTRYRKWPVEKEK